MQSAEPDPVELDGADPVDSGAVESGAVRSAESSWAQRLREATERLDAVGLPEPKYPVPDSQPDSQLTDGRTPRNRTARDYRISNP